MGLLLTKIQYRKTYATNLTCGEVPYYEKEGKFYLKDTDEEVTIEFGEEMTAEEWFNKVD